MDKEQQQAYFEYCKETGKIPKKVKPQSNQINIRLTPKELEKLKLIKNLANKSLSINVALGDKQVELNEILPRYQMNLTLGSIARHLIVSEINRLEPDSGESP